MGLLAPETLAEVIGAGGGVQEIGIAVQLLRADLDHGLHFLEDGLDVPGLAVLHGDFLVIPGLGVFVAELLLFLGHMHEGVAAVLFQEGGDAGLIALVLDALDGVLRFPELHVGEVVHEGVGLGRVGLPDFAVVGQEVRGGREAEAGAEGVRQDAGLGDVGLVGGLIEIIPVLLLIFLRRNIIRGGGDPLPERDGAAPDGIQLRGIQRGIAVLRPVFEKPGGFLRVAEAEEDLGRVAGEGRVPPALRDFAGCLGEGDGGGGLIRLALLKPLVQRQGTGAKEDLRIAGAVEEAGGVQGLFIEEGEELRGLALEGGIVLGAFRRTDGEEAVEAGAGRLRALLLHVIAAEVEGQGDALEEGLDLLRGDPVLGTVAVVVVTVHGEAVRGEEVLLLAIVIAVGDGHIVTGNGPAEGSFVTDFRRMGIQTVAFAADAVGCE